MNMNTKILDYIKKKGAESNLELRLIYNKMATYNGEVVSSGFFDYPEANSDLETPILVVGIDKPESQWMEVLLHEFCHYKQWKKQTPLWKAYQEAYKNHKDGDPESFSMIESAVNMEAECEKSTIKLARKLEYFLDEERYIKKVNAYLLFYQIYHKEKKWYKQAPFEQKNILKLMPNKIIEKPMVYTIDKELYNFYIACLS